MRAPIFLHTVWTLVAAGTFAVGYLVSDGQSAISVIEEEHSSMAAPLVQEPDHTLAERAPSAKYPALSAEQAGARAFEVLAIPNRLERMKQLVQLLTEVSPENWREVMEGCTNQVTSEFRLNRSELDLVFARIGEVAGPAAITEALSSRSPNDQARAAVMLTGWTAASPKAAAEWFLAQAPEWQRGNLKPFVSGLSQAQPVRAVEFALLESDTRQQQVLVNSIVDNAIQVFGFREAEHLFTPLMSGPDVEENPKGRIFAALADRRIAVSRLTENVSEYLGWLDTHAYPHSAVGPMALERLITNAAQIDPETTMDWIDERRDRLRHSSVGFKAAATTFAQRDPEKFVAWMDSHPDHPEYDRLLLSVASFLSRSSHDAEMKRLASTITDPSIRMQVDVIIANAAARR